MRSSKRASIRYSLSEAASESCAVRRSIHRKRWNAVVRTPFWQANCNYSYVSNTVSTYHIEPSHQVEKFYKTSENTSGTISGTYKDDDSKYSLKSLLECQEKELPS